MTLKGWICKQADNRLGKEWYPVYQRFQEAYHDSRYTSFADQIQSGSWVIAVITYHILSNITEGSIYGIQYPGISIAIIGILGLVASFWIVPLVFYRRHPLQKFTVDWFPLREKSYLIKKADEGVLRLGQMGEVIAVVIRPMGTVDGVDIQLVSDDSNIEFEVDGSLGSLNTYPDDNGFYTDDSVDKNVITPILSVNKDRDIGGAPDPNLYLMDVSGVDNDIPGELSNEEAEKEGVELLSIEVEE